MVRNVNQCLTRQYQTTERKGPPDEAITVWNQPRVMSEHSQQAPEAQRVKTRERQQTPCQMSTDGVGQRGFENQRAENGADRQLPLMSRRYLKNKPGPDEIELFFNCQRPEVSC